MQQDSNNQSSKWHEALQEWTTKSTEERLSYLSKFWQCPVNEDGTLTLVAKYEKRETPDKNGNPYGFFIDVRDQEGDLLRYPFHLGSPRIWSKAKDKWEGNYWTIKVKVNQKDFKNPFALTLANEILGKPSNAIQEHIQKEDFIRKIYNETGATERDAKNTVNALLRITGDLYTERERFIFELLQNADDAPNEKGYVDTEIHILSEYMLFLHNGRPFSDTDVESIASIGDSTKKKDSTTTGYKGIGFKALFTEVDSVIIRSGSFSFAFDKHSPLYRNKDLAATPWQLKPIWQERYRYPREVRNHEEFMSFPVSLALSLTEPSFSKEKLKERVQEYKISIKSLFSEPRFLLFLRHINSVKIKGIEREEVLVEKLLVGDARETLRLEVDGNLRSLWKVHSVVFDISEATREAMRASKETPEKMKEMLRSQLSFAAKIASNGAIQSVAPSESVLFTYLPTSVNRYYLPFLVNADFLTTASREDIHRKNPWNIYLFEQIGYHVFHWIARLAQGDHKNEIVSIIPQRYEETEAVTEAFNVGFDRALDDIAFLPTASGKLSKVAECFIDQTGWGEVVGDWIFELLPRYQSKYRLTGDLQDGDRLISRIGLTSFVDKDLYEIFKKHDFYCQLKPDSLFKAFETSTIRIQDFVERADLTLLNDWLGTQTDATREKFATLLENSGLRQETRKILNNLCLWKFGEDICDAFSAYKDSAKVWLRPQVCKIVDILGQLGFVVSSEDYGARYPNVYSHLTKRDDKSLFEQLKTRIEDLQPLEFTQRKTLLLAFVDQEAKWDGIGSASVAELPIFLNMSGLYSPLSLLISPEVSSSAWLSEFILHEEEYFCEQNELLISEKEVYTKVIFPKWETLAEKFNDMDERLPEHLYADIAHFYKFCPNAKPLSSLSQALFPNQKNELLHRGGLFYHKAIEQLPSSLYEDLDLAIRSFDQYLPNRSILPYLSDESSPFILSATDESTLILDEEQELSSGPLKALVDFFVGTLRWRFFEKWGVSTINEEAFRLFESSDDRRQYWIKDMSVQRFVEEQLSENLCLLPAFLAKYKEEGGILSGNDLHKAILQQVSVEDHREVLVDFVAYSAKKTFLQDMGTIRVSLASDADEFPYKVVKLAIEEEYSLRNQLEIENDGDILELSDLPKALENNFSVGGERFSLSTLIPDEDLESGVAIDLLDKFIKKGFDKEKLLRVFGFEEGEDSDEAIQRVVDFCMPEGADYPIATNREQLLFFVCLEKNGMLDDGFACYDATQKPNKEVFFAKSFNFIEEAYTLSPIYGDLPLPLISQSVQIYEEPIIDENDEFKLHRSLCQNLSVDAQNELLKHLLSLYQADPKKFSRVDWDKLDGRDTCNVLGFTPSVAILAAEEDYILEEEKIPENITAWANDEIKQGVLFAMGVVSDSSPIIGARKYFFGASLTMPNQKGTPDIVERYKNTLYWLEKQEITLSTQEQYELFQAVVEAADERLEKRWLIEEISERAEEWDDKYYIEHRDDSLSCRIYLHKDRMPRGVYLRGEDYLFYRYSSDSRSFKEGDGVYVRASLGDDIENELYKLLSREEYGLIFASRYNEVSEKFKSLEQKTERIEQKNQKLELENETLKKKLEAYEARYGQVLPNTPKPPFGKAGSGLDINTSIDGGLSEKERIKAQLEAQKALMDTYHNWKFPEGYGTEDGNYLSVVRGIRDEYGNKIVVVLKSYRDQSKPLNMTAEECEALLNEGARLCLCVRAGNNLEIEEGNFMSLIDGQEKVCVSFDATNLTGTDVQEKVQKFVMLLRYFNGLHLAVEKFDTSSYIQRCSLYTRRVGGQSKTNNNDL